MKRTDLARLALLLVTGAALVGCETEGDPDPDPQGIPSYDPAVDDTVPEIRTQEKEVTLRDGQDNEIGVAHLTDDGEDGVLIHVVAENLPPGPKAIHFHEDPRCEGPDFESSGGHFDPDGRSHGFDDPEGFHVGDIENLEVENDGTVDMEVRAPRARMDQSEQSILRNRGTALVIHAEEDDYVTDPSGDSGDRIACGVVSRGAED